MESQCRQIQTKENKLLKELQAARSEEFDAIFQADTNAKEIEIPEMAGEELKAFVSFFYTGSLPINVIAEYMTTFLHVAEKYKVHYLAAVCEDVLVSKLSRDNAITTFDIAKKYCSGDVKEAVLKKALKMGEISTYGEYKLYTQKDPGLLLEFYEQLSERIGPLLAKRRRITPGMFDLALWTLQPFFFWCGIVPSNYRVCCELRLLEPDYTLRQSDIISSLDQYFHFEAAYVHLFFWQHCVL